MPTYQMHCPRCQHRFSGLVFAGTRMPEFWVCPQCGAAEAAIRKDCRPIPHPLEAGHGSGCLCCGGGGPHETPRAANQKDEADDTH